MQTGLWSSDDCFKQKPFVCEIPQSFAATTPNLSTTKSYPAYKNCSDGWSYFEATHSCYGTDNIGNNTYTWADAEKLCLNQSAHSVSLHTPEEAQFVSEILNFAVDFVWTGLYSDDNEVTWHWTDGSPVDYLPWYHDYPYLKAPSCAYIYDEHIFDNPCEINYFAICKRSATIYFK
uniref:C-type lectin domain-containing protein n=1 Tax=Panagrolaimus superbus TaxID=310955 RepID=A0A914Z8F6_9BILA